MRRRLAILSALCALAATSGCGRYVGPTPGDHEPRYVERPSSHASAEPTPIPSPESPAWVISPDSFGPITTDMTKNQILATGFFRTSDDGCGRLDWHTQTYGYDEGGYKRSVTSGLASITLQDDKPMFIDPGVGTRTDAGISYDDTLESLKAAYPGRLVRQAYMGFPDEDNYGVSGKHSHLVFYVQKGRVKDFYLAPGALAEGEEFSAAMRGAHC